VLVRPDVVLVNVGRLERHADGLRRRRAPEGRSSSVLNWRPMSAATALMLMGSPDAAAMRLAELPLRLAKPPLRLAEPPLRLAEVGTRSADLPLRLAELPLRLAQVGTRSADLPLRLAEPPLRLAEVERLPRRLR
jgi:hypothetical protein